MMQLSDINFPATVLSVLLLLVLLVLYHTQKKKHIDLAGAILDNDGKVSAYRIAVLMSMVISSWVLVLLSTQLERDIEKLYAFYLTYLVVWSGAKTIDKALDLIIRRYVKEKT